MSLQMITAAKAKNLIDQGAVLVDVREPDEYARERVPGALNRPLSRLPDRLDQGDDAIVLFHCRSGARTGANRERLAKTVCGEAYIVEGGLEALKASGISVAKGTKQPIELMRQVQITAGSLVLIGAILGFLVHPGFYGLSVFVGAGLVFSGVSGSCAMANMLRLAPWNRGLAGGM